MQIFTISIAAEKEREGGRSNQLSASKHCSDNYILSTIAPSLVNFVKEIYFPPATNVVALTNGDAFKDSENVCGKSCKSSTVAARERD